MKRVLLLCVVLVGSLVLLVPQKVVHAQGIAPTQHLAPNHPADPPQLWCYQDPSDYNCTGYDPGDPNQMCTNPYTIAPATPIKTADGTEVASIEIRFSNACQSNWARITVVPPINNWQINFSVTIHRSLDGRSFSDGSFPENYTQVYTDMVYAPGHTCVWADGSIGTLSAQTPTYC